MGSKWQPGDRVQIRPDVREIFEALRFAVLATAGKTGTVMSVSGDLVEVKWDAQEWQTFPWPGAPFGAGPSENIRLASFVNSINRDHIAPLE
jgi:hypothetical protein